MGLTNKEAKDYGEIQCLRLEVVENRLIPTASVNLQLTMQEASDLLDRLLMSDEEDNEALTSVLRKLIDALPA